MNKKKLDVPRLWQEVLPAVTKADSFLQLQRFVLDAYQNSIVYPPLNLVFAALELTPPQKIKVVILGQDPYHGPNQANGLCFSVHPNQPIPPSLQNIFKAYCQDLGLMAPSSGDLSKWAAQGVLLLNATLTVTQDQPGAHFNRGWEPFTDAIIAYLSKQHTHLVFMLWGNKAQQKKALINTKLHLVLEAPHPSPLSAYRGFLSCEHFSKTNAYLVANGLQPVNWELR